MSARYVVKVTEVIERDVDRVLVGGDDELSGDRVTFHVRAGSRHLDRIEAGIRAGTPLVMELNPKERAQ